MKLEEFSQSCKLESKRQKLSSGLSIHEEILAQTEDFSCFTVYQHMLNVASEWSPPEIIVKSYHL
jgi:hypothetical protein